MLYVFSFDVEDGIWVSLKPVSNIVDFMRLSGRAGTQGRVGYYEVV